jgi:hypothetical protein
MFVAVVALRLPGLLSSFYWYSDFPNALQLAGAVFHGGWGHGLLVRSQSGLGPLWLVGLLDQVTGSVVAGVAFGGVLLLAAAALMVRTAQRVIGPHRALAVGVLCIAAPPVVAWEALSPLAHISTVVVTAAAAWQLVALSQPARSRMLWSSLAVGVLAGVCVVSDTLALAAAVCPWLICAFALARQRPERRLSLTVTACSAVVAGLAVATIASVNGIVASRLAVNALSLQGIAAGLRVTASTLGQMLAGGWYDDLLPGAVTVAALVRKRNTSTRTIDVRDVLGALQRRVSRESLLHRARYPGVTGELPGTLSRRVVVRDRRAVAGRAALRTLVAQSTRRSRCGADVAECLRRRAHDGISVSGA